ncbi:DNA cytosine methyltransferase [Bifidobacterium boum]|uniref:DNA cytosine methyltransferase n=1 Tax=Bifidobacterium boum TaxID=78343 RepID=UPI003F92DFEF
MGEPDRRGTILMLTAVDFFCADEQTEILTVHGWRLHDEVEVGDLVASLNVETGIAGFAPVEQVHRFDATDERMLRIHGKGISALVTADHRWPTWERNRRGGSATMRWRTTRDLTSESMVKRSAPFNLPKASGVRNELVELVGWAWTEGNFRAHGRLHIYQSRSHNPDNCRRITAALTALYGPPGRRTDGRAYWTVSDWGDQRCWRLNRAAAAPVAGALVNKAPAHEWMLCLTQAQLDLLIEVSMLADGTRRVRDLTHEATLTQGDPDRCDAFQFAAILAGHSTSVRTWHQRYRGTEVPMWTVALMGRDTAKPLRQNRVEWVDHTGVVWCPTVEHGTWLCRRDGMVHWTGNCGMGGSSTGLRSAGYDIKVAANHWQRAIETHSANHPDTEHLCADISAIDLRYLPRTDVLWASPICTEVSPAGGHRKRTRQLDLFEEHGHVPTEAFERTRVTFWEVIRAAELFRYPLVMIENVVEAAQWELFDTWLAGMTTLGYTAQFVSVSAAHIGSDTNPPAPQWRDRMYIVFNRKGVPAPDVRPRPLAWCEKCGTDVAAMQWWKRPGRHIGKYDRQYIYVCPEGDHGRVEPYVRPAASAIDWTDVGTRIGDRTRPLAASTMRRVETGLEMLLRGDFDRDFVMSVNNGGSCGRHFGPASRPLPTQLGVVSYLMGGAGDQKGTSVHAPMRTQRASGADFLVTLRRHAKPSSTSDPLATFTGAGFHHGLVIPFRRGSRPYPAVADPLSTMATRDQHGVLTPAINVEDCYFRMLKPREAANAQAFPRHYIIHGNQGEQQMQAGNAVAVNVAHWLGLCGAQALGAAA